MQLVAFHQKIATYSGKDRINSTQLNFIDERIKTTTDIVIKINTN